ncbi:MAG: peptide-methionine (S)-S-oxide reductase MsrA [Planctomycetes bacterium]|nr:peptide-methionine (S)-S-oxide reductase MsrA [Planctomycetota bacterium]
MVTPNTTPPTDPEPIVSAGPTTAIATFGAGCFWCIEAVLERLDGVLTVTAGYMGGQIDNPTYRQICNGDTGHAEVVQVEFDPAKISYSRLIDWFFQLHDPTTKNAQGPDHGTQYRSAIFVHDDDQRAIAEARKVHAQARLSAPIVTEITAASTFWPAEGYHQDFFRGNEGHPYSQAWIVPKLQKLGLDGDGKK